MVKFGMVRIGGTAKGSKYNIYALHEDNTPKGKPVYKNVLGSEGLRIIQVLNEWQPKLPSNEDAT